MRFNLNEYRRLQELLLNAMGSDNTDYILSQLSRIYTMIYNNNIGETDTKYLCEDTDYEDYKMI